MEKIVKCPKRQDCHYKLTPGSSNETSINLSNEIFKFLKPEGAPTDIAVEVTFTVFKEDFVKALCYLMGKLPLYKTASGKSTEITYSNDFFVSQCEVINNFFGQNNTATYHANLLNRGDGRIYLNNLDDNGFNIRRFLIEANSVLTFINDSENFSVRLSSSSELFGMYSSTSSSNDTLDSAVSLLLENKNLILTGAPGTGKTFLARSIAASIIGDCTWDKLSSEQKKQVGFIQFHPSYDYTDFVEGLRPDENGSFVRTDGAFKDFCKRALGEYVNSAISNSSLFDIVYTELIDDISGGVITEYTRIKADNSDLGVNGKGQIIYGPSKKHGKTESKKNMKLLFDHFVGKEKFDVSDVSREDMWALISELTEGKTKTLDYTEYLWTLNNLLSRVNGRYQNCDNDAAKVTDWPYVFIIDEINRGELSKIFGELFYSIEQDYRGEAGRVVTQYNNMVDEDDVFKEGFFIPKNVYVIGTMNDVDRGVEAMDFAIRRRFAWKEVTVEESAENMQISLEATKVMTALNSALKEGGLGNAYLIGGAYFRKLEGSNYKRLWENHLKGIITEYFRGEPEADSKVKNIEVAYTKAQEESAE